MQRIVKRKKYNATLNSSFHAIRIQSVYTRYLQSCLTSILLQAESGFVIYGKRVSK